MIPNSEKAIIKKWKEKISCKAHIETPDKKIFEAIKKDSGYIFRRKPDKSVIFY